MNFRSTIVTRLDSIMIGVVVAWIYTFKKQIFENYRKILFIIGFLIYVIDKFLITADFFSFSDSHYLNVWYYLVNPISIGMMLPFFYYLKTPKNKFVTNTITVGSLISYSMYLVNLNIVSYLLINPLAINYVVKYFLFWIFTIGFSVLMYKYIELTFMKMR